MTGSCYILFMRINVRNQSGQISLWDFRQAEVSIKSVFKGARICRMNRTNPFIAMRNQSGQTLIELMASLVIITIALSGVVAIFPYIIQKNVRIQMQSQAINMAQTEMEKLKALRYFDSDLDALGNIDGMITTKTVDNFLVRVTVKYIDPKTGLTPEKYPFELAEDTGLKEVTVSVKRKDNIGSQANLVSFISKAKPGRG
jgi:prepilin-type N-terminal cleavage/methylation domain-containing protein